jgi:SAM-dependent methyltransferase
MGINVHGFNLLKYAAGKKPFGRVATIGRQALHVPPEKLRRLLGLTDEVDFGAYCEELLKTHFGAASIESFDNSAYEHATHLVDLNKPLVAGQTYDTVIDLGCLEHIYNAPQALRNLSEICAEGGQILHLLPANNFCGHGFWQFSPELFFSLYSEPNGYRETEVFLADEANENCWFEVKRPRNGNRAETSSATGVFVLVRTVRTSSFAQENVQQSDYVYVWNNMGQVVHLAGRGSFESYTNSRAFERRLKRAIGRLPLESFVRRAFKQLKQLVPSETALSRRNPHLIRRTITDLGIN